MDEIVTAVMSGRLASPANVFAGSVFTVTSFPAASCILRSTAKIPVAQSPSMSERVYVNVYVPFALSVKDPDTSTPLMVATEPTESPVSAPPSVKVTVTLWPTITVPLSGFRTVVDTVGVLASTAGVVLVNAEVVLVFPTRSSSVILTGRALAARSVWPSWIV